jgi:hypothetical protein
MQGFQEALKVAVNSLSLLSLEFERLETDHSDQLTEDYPFSQDLREIVGRLMEWQETIKQIGR